MTMFISFKCPHCQTSLQAGNDLAGEKGKCPNCGKEITVPGKDKQTPNEGNKTAKKD